MKMKRMLIAALCFGALTLAGGGRLAAADKAQATADQELRAKMAAQGWKEITLGVFERQLGPNKAEHLGYGREGLVWTIEELNRQHDALQKEYQRYPSEELHKVLDELGVKIAAARRELRNTKSLGSKLDAYSTGCSICYGATADAYPLTGASNQGVGAVADANFSSTCGSSGDTYAYAYARATLNGTTTTHTVSDPHTGTSVTSHAAASVNGASNCSSSANSYAQSTALGISYTTSTSNSSCPIPVAVSGPSTASIGGTSCQTLTWTTTVTGGVPPLTYAWTVDGVASGTSSSVSKTYCGNGTNHTQTVNFAVTVTDSTGNTGSASASTAITYTVSPQPVISGPTSVYATTACRTVTWTSSVTGGTTPYTYSWTVDGTSAGTGTSASRQFCSYTDETASVVLTVYDAASQSGTATYSTYVNVDHEPACNPICP
jgi:hypothetical protein